MEEESLLLRALGEAPLQELSTPAGQTEKQLKWCKLQIQLELISRVRGRGLVYQRPFILWF